MIKMKDFARGLFMVLCLILSSGCGEKKLSSSKVNEDTLKKGTSVEVIPKEPESTPPIQSEPITAVENFSQNTLRRETPASRDEARRKAMDLLSRRSKSGAEKP